MTKLFVYGTLQSPKVQKELIGRETTPERDVLSGYSKSELLLDGSSYPVAVQSSGRHIEGCVISVTSNELGLIDTYETAAYKRIRVNLQSGKRAWVYVSA